MEKRIRKSEVIKLMKEGTYCIYNDCPEKENQLKEILSYLQRSDYEGKLIVGQYYALSNDTPKIIWRGKILDIVYDVINLTEIEPDNEKPKTMKIEQHIKNAMKDCPLTEDQENALLTGLEGFLNEIESNKNNEKPYLYFEGERYYFGEEYEFSSNETDWVKEKLTAFDYDFKICSFKTPDEWKVFIRKIDHTTKYKKLLLELKEQAEKDGVNLKELI